MCVCVCVFTAHINTTVSLHRIAQAIARIVRRRLEIVRKILTAQEQEVLHIEDADVGELSHEPHGEEGEEEEEEEDMI